MTLGEKITKLREEKKLSREELASALSVSWKDLAKWERDAKVPDMDTMLSLCDFFGVTFEDMTERGKLLPKEEKRDRLFSKSEVITIFGIALLLLTFLLTSVFQLLDRNLSGEWQTYAQEYLKVYPLNIWFYSGILILLIGIVGILYEKIKK